MRQAGRAVKVALALVMSTSLSWACAAGPSLQATHVLQRGDSIWQLAHEQLNCLCHVDELLKLNQITDPLHLVPGTTLKVPVSWLKRLPGVAQAAHVSGKVMWASDEHVPLQPLGEGSRLSAPALIQTGSDGQCSLTLSDGSRVLIRPDSLVRLQQIEQTGLVRGLILRVRVERGSVENVVKPRKAGGHFDVGTPSAVATVRGTDFRVSADAQGMRTEVLGGAVQVSNAKGSKALAPGTGIVVAQGARPSDVQPLLAAPDAARLPGLIERFPLVVALPDQPGVVAYRTQWRLQGNPLAQITEPTAVKPTLVGIGVPDGDHVLRVRAIDVKGLEGLPADVPVRVHRRPDPPIYLSPLPDVVISEERPDVAWARGETSQVRLQVGGDPSFNQPWIDATVSNDGRTSMLKSLGAGTWFWRMAAVDAKGEPGPWGPTQRLTRQPAAPKTEAPREENNRMVMRWEPVAGAQRYEVALSEVGSDQAPHIYPVDGDAFLALPTDLSSGDYDIKVRAMLSTGVGSDWSAPQRLTVPRRWSFWPAALLLLIPLIP